MDPDPDNEKGPCPVSPGVPNPPIGFIGPIQSVPPPRDECSYLSSIHAHPLDGSILFEPIAHTYTFVDNPQPRLPVQSVTEFISTYYPEFNVHIAHSVAKSVNKRFQFWYDNRHRYPDPRTRVPPFNDGIWPDKYDVHVSPEIFTSILHKQPIPDDIPLPIPLGKYTTEHVEHAWSRDGTRLHNEIERFLNRVPTIPPCAKEWKRFVEFLHHNADQRWWRTEFRMGCPDWHICGSTDAIAIGPDGEYVLWDWKRSGKLKADASQDVIHDRDKRMNAPFGYIPATDRNKYYFQLNIYKMILKKRYNIHIAAMYLMVIHPTLDRYLKIAVPDFETRHPKTYALLKRELDKRALANVGAGANASVGAQVDTVANAIVQGEGKRSKYFAEDPLQA